MKLPNTPESSVTRETDRLQTVEDGCGGADRWLPKSPWPGTAKGANKNGNALIRLGKRTTVIQAKRYMGQERDYEKD